jgi:hypothetical protein
MSFRSVFKKLAPIVLAVAAIVQPELMPLIGNFVLTAGGVTATVSTATAAAIGSATVGATVSLIQGGSPQEIAINLAKNTAIGATAGAVGGAVGAEAGSVAGAAARSATGTALQGGDLNTIIRNSIASAAGTGIAELSGSQSLGRLAGQEIATPGNVGKLVGSTLTGIGQDYNADQRQQDLANQPDLTGGSPEKAALYSNEGYGGESATTTSPVTFTARAPKPRASPAPAQRPAQQPAGDDNVTSAPTDTGTGTQTSTVGTIDAGAAGNLADGLGTSTSRIPGVSTTLGGSLSTARAPGDVSTDPTGGPQKAGWNEKSLRYLLGL